MIAIFNQENLSKIIPKKIRRAKVPPTPSSLPKRNWKIEFDQKFGKAYMSDKEGGHFVGSYLIEFIDNLLSLQRQEMRKRMEGMRIKMTHTVRVRLNLGQYKYSSLEDGADQEQLLPEYQMDDKLYEKTRGYNQALDDIIKLLTDKELLK